MREICSMARVTDSGDVWESLFYCKDMKNGGHGLVDEVDGYDWFREKSNDCVARRGFSFYYARHTYDDEFFILREDVKKSTSWQMRYQVVGRPFMLLNQDILMVVEAEGVGGKTRIISARVIKDGDLFDDYKSRKQGILAQRQRNIDYMAKQMSCL